MKKAEWEVISVQAFAGWWGAPLEPDQTEAWFLELQGFTADEVLGALRSLLRGSPRFAPRLGELIAKLEPQPLGFDEAWMLITPVLRDGTALEADVAVGRIAEVAGPLVAGWVASYGVRKLALEPTLEPQFGGAVLKRIGQSYAEMVGSDTGRRVALERAQRAMAVLEARERAALPEAAA